VVRPVRFAEADVAVDPVTLEGVALTDVAPPQFVRDEDVE
jgi:hypothetical protein